MFDRIIVTMLWVEGKICVLGSNSLVLNARFEVSLRW